HSNTSQSTQVLQTNKQRQNSRTFHSSREYYIISVAVSFLSTNLPLSLSLPSLPPSLCPLLSLSASALPSSPLTSLPLLPLSPPLPLSLSLSLSPPLPSLSLRPSLSLYLSLPL